MSGNRKPGGEFPPPINPDNVREACANEVFSIEIGGGFAKFVFGMREFKSVEEGKPPIMVRRITSEPVLSAAALDDMMKKLLTMNRAAQQHELLMKKPDDKKSN